MTLSTTTPSSTTPSSWSAYAGLPLLRTIATGIVQLDKGVQPKGQVYPAAAQRALDQLVLLCLRQQVPPPNSVPDMIRWARTIPVDQWPLELPEDVAGAGELLVDEATNSPTQACHEWVVDAADATAEQIENRLMGHAIDQCRSSRSPQAYTTFRRLLISRPVLTGVEIASLLGEDGGIFFKPTLEVIKQSYQRVPASLQVDGQCATCRRCGCLLTPLANGGWRCELDRCRYEGAASVGRMLGWRDDGGLFQIARPLRVFITGPGRAETELEAQLAKLGLTITMWPEYDTYDLHVPLPGGGVWAIDVKDRANPALLGRSARPFRSPPRFDRAFLVVPDYRFKQRDGYRTIFNRHRPEELRGVVDLVTDSELVAMVRKEIRAAKRSAAVQQEAGNA